VGGFLIILILFGAVWLVFLLPARRRRFAHQAMQDSVSAGDDVITAGGIHGRVVSVEEDDTVRLEIAPSVVVTLDRRAVAAVATEVEVEVEPEDVTELSPDREDSASAREDSVPGGETSREPR
jgi:preprotein translocase subunit YajC